MGAKYIVQGAECECQFGTAPDKIKVLTQTSVFLNDSEGEGKLAVTTTDIGTTFEKNSFGSCKNQTFSPPCVATITQWSGEEKQAIAGAGNFLTEESKATCPLGGPDCISVVFHGQQAEITSQNIENADNEVQTQINPLVDLERLDEVELPTIKLNVE